MIQIRLAQSGLLKKIIDSIKDIVTDANLDISSTGLSLQAMDSSHVSLVSLFLQSEGFESFRCDQAVTLGVNLVSLYKILKCSSNEDSVTITWKDDPEILSFFFESHLNDRISEFQLRLIQRTSDQLGIPLTNYPASIRLTSSEYRRICTDLSALGDSVVLEISNQGIKFEVEGDIGKGSITLKPAVKEENKVDRVHIESTDSIKMLFSMRYLSSFSKATPLCDKIILKIGKDVPLQMEFKIESFGFVRFYLAPKVDNET
ncbi:proliferating cell nuclear antigen (nucleomorph) [Chroomonas mesostigmatica CCMP1168]|uniref:DNA sliding clamp PCNA n=1 Tax=Chroomonas mesostigmatica CCMP1168 TaxID=1195612 RepID=J7G8F7_9CRYP|nr:proliferating cell nuclear antigen [Chroomonas mesostigmatica CCMP1168]|mmetsp:Transcript_21536/g.53145  ORF Transcript_21536/g.53145 Transcript_21536/m.53145 type:complete len:260 (-) Transcript_21536:341-1120(-)